MPRIFRATISALCLAVASACCGPTAPPSRAYFGPTDPPETVVAAINANAASLASLNATHEFDLELAEPAPAGQPDAPRKTRFLNGTGNLQFLRPGGFRMTGDKDIAGRIFEIGANADEFWLMIVPETDTLWYGSRASAGNLRMGQMPIDPELLLQTLGVSAIDTNLLRPPSPVFRFNNDADVYMITFVTPGPTRLVAQREVWYDRATKLPLLVLLYDANGRVVLRARLSGHAAVDGAPAPAPSVARKFELFFPDTGSRMEIRLTDVVLQRRNLPRPGSIRRPQEPPVNKVISVDENKPH